MKNLKDAKQIYDSIVIPEELDSMLRDTLNNAPQSAPKRKLLTYSRWTLGAAAALLICFSAGLNTSRSFAMEASRLPVIGSLARVLTLRSYEITDDTTTTKVDMPEIQVTADNKEVAKAITDVNAEIQSIVDEFTARKYEEIAEYKEAFFATGGTEEDWKKHEIDVNVSYEVKYQSNTKLSILLDAWIGYINVQEERRFYNIDLVTGKELTLTDLLGEDAYEYATKTVLAQMNEMIKDEPDAYVYWGVNDNEITEEFAGVTEETPFYINEAGNVVISYSKYEAGPGYMGVQEFEIPSK